MRDLKSLTRQNIFSLEPYSCARDEYSGSEASVFLDANESPYNYPYNRYPDPLQKELKKLISKVKQVPPSSIFLGNGSDEAIDLIYRCFAEPAKDNVVAMDPTYGMYKVAADINNVEYRAVPLDKLFLLNANKLLQACDSNTKVIWICSPNNPTGNSLNHNEIEKVIKGFDGLVVIDEAYADFSQATPFRLKLNLFPNIIVLNTMSKAWASASIRLGMAFASPDIIQLLNKVKYPYNVNSLSQQYAIEAFKDPFETDRRIRMILQERERLMDAFSMLPFCLSVYPSDANFFLIKVNDAEKIYNYLISKGIIVRNRSNATMCDNCLRITIGTPRENAALLAALRCL